MRHSTPGISKIARKKGKDIELEIRNLGGLDTLKNIILEGLGFRGGSDEKMRRMWHGLEIYVAGLPSFILPVPNSNKILIIKIQQRRPYFCFIPLRRLSL